MSLVPKLNLNDKLIAVNNEDMGPLSSARLQLID